MSYEQYWYGDPLMVRAFYEVEQRRLKRKDREAWLFGLYMVAALNATVGNIGNHGTLNEYPKEPFSMKKEERAEEMTEEDKERDAVWAEAWMSSLVQAGQHWGRKE